MEAVAVSFEKRRAAIKQNTEEIMKSEPEDLFDDSIFIHLFGDSDLLFIPPFATLLFTIGIVMLVVSSPRSAVRSAMPFAFWRSVWQWTVDAFICAIVFQT